MADFLSHVYFDNTVQDYFIALLLIAALMFGLRVFRRFILARLKKVSENTDNPYDDFLVFILEAKILPLLNIFAIYMGLVTLTYSDKVEKYLMAGLKVAAVYFVAKLVTASLQFAFEQMLQRNSEENDLAATGKDTSNDLKGIMIIVKVIVWVMAFVFLLDNLGYDVTAVVAGLGIGGIAIALAAQTILGDLFSYFVIFFDRPFEVGDFINVDDKYGTVEYVGIKTTRIKSITGEQVVISNTNLTNSRLHNFKKMQQRRVVFCIGVTYQTPKEKLAKIPRIIKSIIEQTENLLFDRCHFSKFGASGLDFETVYFVNTSDYLVYMDAQQKIYLSMFDAFEQDGIEFAYPTQTLFLEGLHAGALKEKFEN